MNENAYLFNLKSFVKDKTQAETAKGALSAVNTVSGGVTHSLAPAHATGIVQGVMVDLIFNSPELFSLHVALDTVFYNNLLNNSAQWSNSNSNWNDILIQDTNSVQAPTNEEFYTMGSISTTQLQFSLTNAK